MNKVEKTIYINRYQYTQFETFKNYTTIQALVSFIILIVSVFTKTVYLYTVTRRINKRENSEFNF